MADLIPCRAKGGHKTHLVDRKTGIAACGFKPSATRRGRLMKFRHGWTTPNAAFGICKQCQAALDKAAAKENT